MNTGLPAALIDFMRDHHYDPHKLNRSGSGFLRFAVGNDRNGSVSGFVKVMADGEAAIFGDFKSGEHFVWQAEGLKILSPAERDARRSLMEKTRLEADAERSRLRAVAASKAAEIYEAGEDARADHPYLVNKGISPCGRIRQHGTQLLVPVYIDDKLASLQFIEADGTKRFLTDGETKGGSLLLGTPGQTICVVEGYATARSIHQATGHAVAVAFNAGNLPAVARDLRSRFGDASLIICADCDQWTTGNPGLSQARKAALVVGAKLAVPDFSGCDLAGHPSDFNDLHSLMGLESIRRDLDAALPVEGETVSDPITDRVIVESAAPPLVDTDIPRAPPRMSPEGFPPLLRDIVESACSHSEAHEVAVAANAIARFCATIGRGIYQRIGDAEIHCRPFMLIVGKSGKARKGTAEATVRKIFKKAKRSAGNYTILKSPFLSILAVFQPVRESPI
ncbi:MAG: toprim domain-containing protein [Nitrosospira sp.]